MSTDANEYVLPSDPKERKKIRDAVYQMSGALQFIADKREFMKDVAKGLKEEFNIPPKVANKMARTVFKHNYQEVLQESSAFELYFENVIGSGDTTSTHATDE